MAKKSDSIAAEPILEAFPVVESAMKDAGIEVGLSLDHISNFDSIDFGQVVFIKFKSKYRGVEIDTSFYTPVPNEGHRKTKDWAQAVAYFFAGAMFRVLQDKSQQMAINFWRDVMPVIDRLYNPKD